MSGIAFFRTSDPDRVVEFYRTHFDAEVWRERADCTILDRRGFRFGFYERPATDDCGVLAFPVADRATVEDRYEALAAWALDPPAADDRYDVYRFFADDPDGRTVEVRTPLDDSPAEG